MAGQRPGVDRAFGGFAGAFAVGIVAVFKLRCVCVVFLPNLVEVGLLVQNSGVVDIQLIARLDFAVRNGLADVDGDVKMGSLTSIAVGVKHNRVIVARERICRIVVDYDGYGSFDQ